MSLQSTYTDEDETLMASAVADVDQVCRSEPAKTVQLHINATTVYTLLD